MPTSPCKLEDINLVWTSCSSRHHDGVSTQWVCQRTHLLLSSREGLGVSDWSESSLLPSPAKGISSLVKNSCTLRLRVGEGSKSSSLGCDQSEWSPHTISSAQDSGQELLASMLGLSSNVSCHLEHDGLRDWALQLICSPWCEDAWGCPLHLSTALDLLHWLLLKCLCLPNWQWLPNHQWPWLMEWLNFLILSSRRATAANTHLWVSCVTATASLHAPLL